MDCEQATLALPWLRNGTLVGDERAAVVAHLRACAACRQALAEVEAAWESFDVHLPAVVLIAYADGVDSELPRAEVEAHLDACPSCRLELSLLREAERQERSGSVTPGPPQAMRFAFRPGRRRVALGALLGRLAAAALVVCAVGWGLWSSSRVTALGAEVARLGAPRLEAPIVELAPAERSLRGASEGARPAVVLGDEGARLVVSTDDATSYEAYRIELLDAGGRVVWSDSTAKLDAQRELAILLTASGTTPGAHELRLSGFARGDWVALDSFPFTISHTEPSPDSGR